MGLIVLDILNLGNSGLKLTGLYYAIGNNTIYCNRQFDEKLNINIYRYNCSFNIYVSKEEKDKGSPNISQIHIFEDSQNNNDGYELLYKKLKSMFENYVDA